MNESLVRAWSAAYSDEVLDWAQPPAVSNMEVFADVYHSLIHSPVSATLLQVDWSLVNTKIRFTMAQCFVQSVGTLVRCSCGVTLSRKRRKDGRHGHEAQQGHDGDGRGGLGR